MGDIMRFSACSVSLHSHQVPLGYPRSLPPPVVRPPSAVEVDVLSAVRMLTTVSSPIRLLSSVVESMDLSCAVDPSSPQTGSPLLLTAVTDKALEDLALLWVTTTCTPTTPTRRTSPSRGL